MLALIVSWQIVNIFEGWAISYFRMVTVIAFSVQDTYLVSVIVLRSFGSLLKVAKEMIKKFKIRAKQLMI